MGTPHAVLGAQHPARRAECGHMDEIHRLRSGDQLRLDRVELHHGGFLDSAARPLSHHARQRRPMKKYIALGLGLVAVAACNPNAALRPKEKGVVTTLGSGALGGLYIGALNDFTVAWSGAGDESNFGHEGQVGLSAIFTDELTAAFLDEFTFRRNLD